MLDPAVVFGAVDEFAAGLLLTLFLLAVSLITGLLLAIPLAVVRAAGVPGLCQLVLTFTWCVRGTPMLVQLLLVYYGLAQFEWMQRGWESGHPIWTLFKEPLFCAWLTFALNTAAYTTELLVGSLRNIPHTEVEAAEALGMRKREIWLHILLPHGLRRFLPGYSNEVILMLHGSSIASVVTVVDLTGAARNVYSQHYAPFEAFGFAGLVYLATTFVLLGIFREIEARSLAFTSTQSK